MVFNTAAFFYYDLESMFKIKNKIPFEKQLHWIIISGLIWGLLELFLAPVIKSYARGVFGIVMPFISITFILSVKYRMPAKGTIFLSAVIASLIKYFFSGMVLTGGFMAILMEAALIEAVYHRSLLLRSLQNPPAYPA